MRLFVIGGIQASLGKVELRESPNDESSATGGSRGGGRKNGGGHGSRRFAAAPLLGVSSFGNNWLILAALLVFAWEAAARTSGCQSGLFWFWRDLRFKALIILAKLRNHLLIDGQRFRVGFVHVLYLLRVRLCKCRYFMRISRCYLRLLLVKRFFRPLHLGIFARQSLNRILIFGLRLRMGINNCLLTIRLFFLNVRYGFRIFLILLLG